MDKIKVIKEENAREKKDIREKNEQDNKEKKKNLNTRIKNLQKNLPKQEKKLIITLHNRTNKKKIYATCLQRWEGIRKMRLLKRS